MIEQHIEELLNLIDEGCIISDRNGNNIYINDVYGKIINIPKEYFMKRTSYELLSDGTYDVILNPEVVQSGKSASRIQTLRDGRKVMLHAHPIFGKNNEVKFVVTFMRDLTAMTDLKDQLEKQCELLEAYQELQSNTSNIQSASIILNSQSICDMFSRMIIVAKTNATVLLLGETGTGKDIFARRIHRASLRAQQPFIKVDCSSLPESLVESELFGYAPNSFSGANSKGKLGLIEAASGGTLFLDEIGELPIHTQSRLLRVLQDKEIVRVGSVRPLPVDVRFIAATNRNLEDEVRNGRFRQDLYYRLNISVFHIPPLRERKKDIIPLAYNFLNFYCKKYGRTLSFSPEVETLFEEYCWPGNVREMENMIHGLVVANDNKCFTANDIRLTEKELAFDDQIIIKDIYKKNFRDLKRVFEYNIFKSYIKRFSSINELSVSMKLDRTTVFRKLREYGLSLNKKGKRNKKR